MEITPKNNSIPIDVYVNTVQDKKAAAVADEKGPDQALKSDTVAISETARQVREARALLDKLPEVDNARVDDLKAQIESGRYEINSEKIAEKMLRESLLNDM